jgi:hypothetical protein
MKANTAAYFPLGLVFGLALGAALGNAALGTLLGMVAGLILSNTGRNGKHQPHKNRGNNVQ